MRLELEEWKVKAFRQGPRRRPLRLRIRRAPAHRCQHTVAPQLLTEHDREEGRIDAPEYPTSADGKVLTRALRGPSMANSKGETVSIKGHFRRSSCAQKPDRS